MIDLIKVYIKHKYLNSSINNAGKANDQKKRLGRAGDRKWHKNGGEQKGVKLNEKEEEIGVEGEMTGVMTVKNWFI